MWKKRNSIDHDGVKVPRVLGRQLLRAKRAVFQRPERIDSVTLMPS